MRLFVALSLPETVRTRLGLLQSGLPNARWAPSENLHLTLRFIGKVEPHVAEEIDERLAEIDAPGFELALSGLGHFGKDRKVRAVWARAEPDAALVHLQAKVESACVRAGLAPEGRKFTPHVTLARFSRAPGTKLGTWLEANGAFSSGPIAVDRFVLYRSHLSSEGPHYEALTDYPLQS